MGGSGARSCGRGEKGSGKEVRKQRSEVRKGTEGEAMGDCRCARWAHWFGGERDGLCAQRAQLQNSRNSHLTQGVQTKRKRRKRGKRGERRRPAADGGKSFSAARRRRSLVNGELFFVCVEKVLVFSDL